MKTDSTPTMKDVAQECGLSLATVSKVINGLPVGKKSRERVEAAIDKLGYQVNAYARALKSSKTYSVALVMPSLKHPFFANLTDELTKSLMNRGYRSILMITNYDHEAEQKSFSLVRSNKMDGVIALTYSPNLEVGESIPIVTIDRHLDAGIPCVSSDNFRGGELAAGKLIELGCKKLLFMRITSRIQGEPNKRCAGFESVCQMKNVDYDTLLFNNDEPEEPIYNLLEEYISDGSFRYDGILQLRYHGEQGHRLFEGEGDRYPRSGADHRLRRHHRQLYRPVCLLYDRAAHRYDGGDRREHPAQSRGYPVGSEHLPPGQVYPSRDDKRSVIYIIVT